MKNVISIKGWVLVIGLVVLVFLPPALSHAQTGTATININACIDQNADRDCNDASVDVTPFPTTGVQACLNGSGCKDVPASFTNLLSGTYTAYLRFTGASQGYYPTTGQVSITLATGATENRTLGAVYPVHPKGVAIHESLNKVYVAFQGPIDTGEKPYPFVAVINGATDEVEYTIPGGSNSIGRSPWGVAVSGNNVYVGSFDDGRITIIDATTDTVIGNITKANFPNDNTTQFQPTAPYVDPSNGQVYFPDYRGGRLVILTGTTVITDVDVLDVPPADGYSPFEMVTATKTGGTYNFITLRDSVPTTYKFAGVDTVSPYNVTHHATTVGSPHAIGLWQESGMAGDPRLFITYADSPTGNPNHMAIYSFSPDTPETVPTVNTGIGLGDYAEAGLVYDAAADQMRGTYGGFLFDESSGSSVTACSPTARGGTYSLDYNGTVSAGFDPDVVVGNPRVISDTLHTLQWKNPFEIAINSTNGKVYVTDRCWNDYSGGGQPGGGAVLIYYSINLPTVYLPIIFQNHVFP